MPDTNDRAWGFRTRAIHAGNIPDAVHGARALPIYQTSAFVFDDTADAAARFALQKYGNIYSRLANPTVASFEERVASLEGGLGAVATASGLGAEFITFAALAGAGDHIVASSSLYGGSVTQLDVTLRRFGVDTTFIQGTDPEAYAAAITDKTKLIFVESISNPSGEIADLEGLADVAHAHHLPLIVDSTVATPYLNRPIEWGADVVIHSATKFLGGHGTTLGGVVVESGRFHWANERFPLFDQEVAALRRPQLARQLRRVRVPDPAARRAAARHRPGARSALGVAARAGCRDAAVPDAGARRQRASRRRVARGRQAHRVRELGGAARRIRTTSARSTTCRRARDRCSRSA